MREDAGVGKQDAAKEREVAEARVAVDLAADLAGNLVPHRVVVLTVADPGAQDALELVRLEDAVGPDVRGVGADLEEDRLAHVDLHRGRSTPEAQPVLELVEAGLRADEGVEVVGKQVDAHVDASDVEAKDGAEFEGRAQGLGGQDEQQG